MSEAGWSEISDCMWKIDRIYLLPETESLDSSKDRLK